MDLVGTSIIMGAVVSYLLALQWGGATKTWSDGSVVGALVAFGVLVILFVINEWWMDERALIQPRLFKNRNILAACIFVFFVAGPMFILIYYLPLYFQSIQHVSAAQSGVRNLPFVLSVSLFSIISGGLISAFGQFSYLMVLGSAFMVIGSALIYTLDIGTEAGKWIGYQIVAGTGTGLAVQVPIIVNQALVVPSDLASISAITVFLQTIGGAFWVSAAQAGWVNELLKKLPQVAPRVSPHTVIATGASELHKILTGEDLDGVLIAYMHGLKVTFILCIVTAGISLVASFIAKPVNIKGRVVVAAA